MMGRSGAFAEAVRGLRLLSEAREKLDSPLEISTNTVVCKVNFESLTSLLRLRDIAPIDHVGPPTVVRDDEDPNPGARYKAVSFVQDSRMYEQRELWAVRHYMFISPDGVHWEKPGHDLHAKSESDRFIHS